MADIIQAIVIDGFHKGHIVTMPYHPSVKLLKPTVIMVDTCCRSEEMPPIPSEIIEYKECFRSVDRRVVLYSITGHSDEIKNFFAGNFSLYPWTNRTTLYYGYHDGFLRRTDDELPVT